MDTGLCSATSPLLASPPYLLTRPSLCCLGFRTWQDATCDPLSIRTDAGVVRQLGENEVDAIRPDRLDYMKTKARGDADVKMPLVWGWGKRIAFEPFTRGSRPRNHDDMTYQFNMPKHLQQY